MHDIPETTLLKLIYANVITMGACSVEIGVLYQNTAAACIP